MTPPLLRPLCLYRATLDRPQHDTGTGPFGRRLIAVVTGGDVAGERVNGTVLPGGGDWALIDGDVLRLDARVTWQTDDGAKIYVRYTGVFRPYSEGPRQFARGGTPSEADRQALYFRTRPIFETGDARYRWLGDIVAVGVGLVTPTGVAYELHEVL
ncbi:MAG TPA: DUF3237 domain-containing protein [Rhizomicrobium sp.]